MLVATAHFIVSSPHGVAAHVNWNKQRSLPISSLLTVCRRSTAGASFPLLEPVKGKICFLLSSIGLVDVSETIRVSGPTLPASKVHAEWTKCRRRAETPAALGRKKNKFIWLTCFQLTAFVRVKPRDDSGEGRKQSNKVFFLLTLEFLHAYQWENCH